MPTQADDLLFGGANESAALPLLRDHLADPTLQKTTNVYSITDFTTPNNSLYVELKSRRTRSDAYPTSIVGWNKICEMDRRTKEGAKCYFAFSYTDGLFVIPYDKELFDTFQHNHSYWRGARSDVVSRPQHIVLIPNRHLTKVLPKNPGCASPSSSH